MYYLCNAHVLHSLDTSDTGITTTVGAPGHYTMRYAAPEVFAHEPRSRLSDIWSLGCVLSDIVSRLHGYKLQTMYEFWKSNGTRRNSYAENFDATAAWFEQMTAAREGTGHHQRLDHSWLASFINHVLLETERLQRPTSAQIFARLEDVSHFCKPQNGPLYVGDCCMQPSVQSGTLPDQSETGNTSLRERELTAALFDVRKSEPQRAFVVLDINCSILAVNGDVDMSNPISSSWFPEEFRCDASLAAEVKDLFSMLRTDIVSEATRNAQTSLTRPAFAEFAKSTYISCSRDVVTRKHSIHFVASWSKIKYTVWLELVRLQLERRPQYGAPFIMMTMQPDEVANMGNQVSYSQWTHPWTPSSSSASSYYSNETGDQSQQVLCPQPGCEVISKCRSDAKYV